MLALLVIQVYKFVMVSFEAFNIPAEFPPLMEKLTIFSAIFLAFLLFKEFLEEEFHFEDVTVYTLLTIFFFSNVNILLKFIIPEEVLVEHMMFFNALPLILIFGVLPFLTYLSEGSFRKVGMLILLSVGIIYPVGQLYPLILDKFVTLIAAGYTVYALLTGFSGEGFNPKEVLHRALEFDEVIVEKFLLHPAKESEDKVAFYLYAVVLFYIISDFALYILPSVTGLWVPGEYLEKLGIELSKVSLPPVVYISMVGYLLLVSHPFLRDATHLGKNAWFNLLTFLLSLLFFIVPSIMMSPLISSEGYGVLMLPWDYHSEPVLVLLAIAAIVVTTTVWAIGTKVWMENWGEVLLSVLPILSLAAILPYILVYAYSLFASILIWYLHSPYLVFTGILLLFLLMAFTIISLRWIKQHLRFKHTSGAMYQAVLFYAALTLLLTVPSIYSTSLFIIIAAMFILSAGSVEKGALRTLFIFYTLSLLVIKHYALISVLLLIAGYLVYDFLGKGWRNMLTKPLGISSRLILMSVLFVGGFIAVGHWVGEIIPFNKTITGFLLLFLFSSAEEIVMKGVLYSNFDTSIASKTLVAIFFGLMHLLNLTILVTYFPILPVYITYLLSYQFLSLSIYDRYRSIAAMSIIHFSVNAGILLLS